MIKSPGIELLRRYVDGEQLSEQELETLRSTMYLMRQMYRPPRTWSSLQWTGIDDFMQEIWPQTGGRLDFQSGLFEHGSVKP